MALRCLADFKEAKMTLIQRDFVRLASAIGVLPLLWRASFAQQPTAKLTLVARPDLEGQDHKLEETVVNLLEMPPAATAPWHMHPGAQELLYVTEGDLVLQVEGKGATLLKAGQLGLIPADIPHLARNESTSVIAKALVTHSRADKDKPLTVVLKRP
jgi:quercetin dioxygenase-like cupin family protein